MEVLIFLKLQFFNGCICFLSTILNLWNRLYLATDNLEMGQNRIIEDTLSSFRKTKKLFSNFQISLKLKIFPQGLNFHKTNDSI